MNRKHKTQERAILIGFLQIPHRYHLSDTLTWQ